MNKLSLKTLYKKMGVLLPLGKRTWGKNRSEMFYCMPSNFLPCAGMAHLKN